jgi:4-aminobutyrate aminotransferase/(S)-3-amino-2-methylpropionate transaminase
MRELDLVTSARRIGLMLGGRLGDLAASDPRIAEVRGRGAMQAIEIVQPGTLTPDPATTGAVSAECHRRGLLTLTCGTYGNVLRFLPPLVIEDRTLDRGLDILTDAFAAV